LENLPTERRVNAWPVTRQTHMHTHTHMPQATTLVREIEVSHWGNIYVEETYELVRI